MLGIADAWMKGYMNKHHWIGALFRKAAPATRLTYRAYLPYVETALGSATRG